MQGIRAGLVLATLLMTGAVSGQTTYTGSLTAEDPTFDRPATPFYGAPSPSCQTSGAQYRYTAYTFTHTGGATPQVTLTSTDLPLAAGFYRGVFDPSTPCTNASAFYSVTNSGTKFNDAGPPGQYVLVVASQQDTTGNNTGSFTLSTTIALEGWAPPVVTPPTAPQAVPVTGAPALALTGFGILAAAGWLRTRRQRKLAPNPQRNSL